LDFDLIFPGIGWIDTSINQLLQQNYPVWGMQAMASLRYFMVMEFTGGFVDQRVKGWENYDSKEKLLAMNDKLQGRKQESSLTEPTAQTIFALSHPALCKSLDAL